jgi:hypothetical protein
MHAGDNDDEFTVEAIEHLEGKPFNQAAPGLAVEEFARFRKAQDEFEGDVDSRNEFRP